MKKLVIAVLCLLISSITTAEAIEPTTLFDSKQSFFKSMAMWSWKDVPNHITTFMDKDHNGQVEVAWAFPIIKDITLPDCKRSSEPEEQKGTITFSTCHTNEPRQPQHLYIVESKGWICHTCPYLHIPEIKKDMRIL